jgi:hypothetical protein
MKIEAPRFQQVKEPVKKLLGLTGASVAVGLAIVACNTENGTPVQLDKSPAPTTRDLPKAPPTAETPTLVFQTPTEGVLKPDQHPEATHILGPDSSVHPPTSPDLWVPPDIWHSLTHGEQELLARDTQELLWHVHHQSLY